MLKIQQTMTSLELAELSGKRHDNVIRDIELILSNVGIDLLKFEEREKYGNNNERKVYRLPKSETLLVTSKWSDAQRWKIIQQLEAEPTGLTLAEQCLLQAQRLVDHERRMMDLEHQQTETRAQLTALVNGEDFFTVVGYANLVDMKVDVHKSREVGKRCAAICRTKGWDVGKAPHPNFGEVNTYPREALEQAFGGGV